MPRPRCFPLRRRRGTIGWGHKMPSVDTLLDTLAGLAAAPFAQAHPLPPEIYHDEALFALEKDRIFGTDWLCAGRAADIPNPGDHLTYRIADQPILVMRGEDGV